MDKKQRKQQPPQIQMQPRKVCQEIHLTLPGSIRSKKNSKQPVPIPAKGETKIKAFFQRRGWIHARVILQPSKQYRKWEKEIRHAVALQYADPLKQGPLHVQMIVYYKGPEPDLSGCEESVGDALEGIVWEDDKQIRSWDGSRVFHDKHNPRTEGIVRPYHLGGIVEDPNLAKITKGDQYENRIKDN